MTTEYLPMFPTQREIWKILWTEFKSAHAECNTIRYQACKGAGEQIAYIIQSEHQELFLVMIIPNIQCPFAAIIYICKTENEEVPDKTFLESDFDHKLQGCLGILHFYKMTGEFPGPPSFSTVRTPLGNSGLFVFRIMMRAAELHHEDFPLGD